MTALTITYIIGTDNIGIDEDELDLVEGYRAEVEARLIDRFPEADVSVVIEHGSSKVLVEGLDWETEESVIETVTAIANEVWNHGNWHNAPWPPVGFGATDLERLERARVAGRQMLA